MLPVLEIDQQVADAVERVATKSVVPIIGGEGGFEFIAGTGILFESRGHYHVLTASHVLQKNLLDREWQVQLYGGARVSLGYIEVAYTSDEIDVDFDVDLAMIRLFDQDRAADIRARNTFLTDEQIDLGLPKEGQRFLFYGYPERLEERRHDGTVRPQFLLGMTSPVTPGQCVEPDSGPAIAIKDLHLRLKIHSLPVDGEGNPTGMCRSLSGISGGACFSYDGPSIYAHDRRVRVCAVNISELPGEWVKVTLLAHTLQGLLDRLDRTQALSRGDTKA